MLQNETFKSESVSLVVHPFPNSKFSSLFTLYDPTHLFKNVRNNWITEKTQTLEFLDPEINEVLRQNGKIWLKFIRRSLRVISREQS